MHTVICFSGSESGDETLSKASASGGDKHLDSWAEDTDVSSAMDDHRKKVVITPYGELRYLQVLVTILQKPVTNH